MSGQEKKAKPIRCLVTSDKMSCSRVATKERLVKDPTFGKYVRRRTKFMFHDAENKSKTGDEVLIMPCSPKSKRKKFQLIEILKESKG